MRLDKFLKVSRLIKRRTVANEVSDTGRVFVNGTLEVRVLIVPTGNVSVQEAPSLYEIITE